MLDTLGIDSWALVQDTRPHPGKEADYVHDLMAAAVAVKQEVFNHYQARRSANSPRYAEIDNDEAEADAAILTVMAECLNRVRVPASDTPLTLGNMSDLLHVLDVYHGATREYEYRALAERVAACLLTKASGSWFTRDQTLHLLTYPG